MKKWLDQYKSGGSANSLNRKVTCSNCGWSWKLSDGGMDPMTCHKCGGDIKMQQGGELDKYQQRGQVNNFGQKPRYENLAKNPNAIKLFKKEDEGRTIWEPLSGFIPGYETYLDVKDIVQGTINGNKAQMNQGVIGLASPIAAKTATSFLDYATEKLISKEVADELAEKRNIIVNMSERQLKELFKRYGYGGYDQWVKDGKPPLQYGGQLNKYKQQGGEIFTSNYESLGLPGGPNNLKKFTQTAIISSRGQWDYPGQTTIIPSNEITMTGVDYPVLGVDNTGHTKMMQPGMNYTFPGQYVTEYPMMQNGGELDKYQDRGQVNFRDQLFQRNKPIIDATAAPILLPPNLKYDKKRVVNSSSAGLNKNQLKQVYKNLKTKADAEKKQEIEEYEASELFHKYNPVAQFLGTRSAPVSSVKPVKTVVLDNRNMLEKFFNLSEDEVKKFNLPIDVYNSYQLNSKSNKGKTWGIASKKNARAYFFDANSNLAVEDEVGFGKDRGEQQPVFYKVMTTPSGTYKMYRPQYNAAVADKLKKGYAANNFFLMDNVDSNKRLVDVPGSTRVVKQAVHGIPTHLLQERSKYFGNNTLDDNFMSAGCINCRRPFLDNPYFNSFKEGLVYVLPEKQIGGEMIRRADGSYSRRGLWDNIRANRGSGKKPTKEMLEQERKIRNNYQNGGLVYNVKEGDNLSTIAKNYNIPLNQLVQTNNIKNPDLILTGQKLIIPKNSGNNDAEMAAIADKRLKYFESQQLSNNKQKPIVENTKINFPKHIQQIPIDPFTHQPLTREQIQMQKFVTPFNKPQPTISQGTWKGNRKTKDNSFDPYLRIIKQDPESEANIGKTKRKELVTKKLPAALGAATGIVAAPTLIASAAPYISAPLTVGATTVPWLTPTTLIGAGFGLHGANQLGNQVSSGYYSSNAPTSEKILTGLTTGLDMLGMPGAVEGLAAHVVSPLYRGALKTGQYVSDGSLPQGLKNVKSFATQSKKDISEAITNIKNIEATRKLHLNDLNSNYQNDILGLIQDPEKIKAEELPTELSYLKNKFIKYFERKLNSRQLSDKFIEDKVFKSIYNQHGGKKKFWDKVNGFGDEQFTNDELKNLYNEISSKVPSKKDASTLINSEFSKLKKQQLYNPLSDAPLIQDFVANKFKLSKPEVLSETNFLDDEKEALSAIRALGKFKSVNQSKKKIKNLLTIPEAVEQLYKHASKIDDSRLKSILPNISREDIITAYEKLKGSGSTVNNTNQQIPQIGNSLPQELTELDPYFRKLALHGHAQHNPSLFSNFVKNYQTSFVPSYNIDAISKSEKLIPLIGNTHHEFDIAPNPKFVNNSSEPEYMLIDVGHEENGVVLNPRVQFLQAIRDVENAKKGSKFIGSNSLSTDSYPIFNNMGVKFTKNGLVVPKFSGHMTGLNQLGYATKNPDLAIKEINSQIEALEKLSGKTFPKAKYIKKNYLVPQIYFERLKYGGQSTLNPIVKKDNRNWLDFLKN